jgi:hypothetical protein
MSWETGSGRIQELIDAGELGQVPPDSNLAQRMLADARPRDDWGRSGRQVDHCRPRSALT